jgi:hypothetical protein
MRQPDFESAIARLHDAWSEFAVAISAAVERIMERLPTLSIHHNSCNEFGRALDWAEKHRPDLVAIYWRTKKWRTEKKCRGRIIKEWRKEHETD